MAAPKLHITDIKMLEIIALMQSHNERGFVTEVYETLGVPKQTVYKIREGIASFTPKHIYIMCHHYNVNANYIFGTSNRMYRPVKTLKNTP